MAEECDKCYGTGLIKETKVCGACKGTGVITRPVTIEQTQPEVESKKGFFARLLN